MTRGQRRSAPARKLCSKKPVHRPGKRRKQSRLLLLARLDVAQDSLRVGVIGILLEAFLGVYRWASAELRFSCRKTNSRFGLAGPLNRPTCPCRCFLPSVQLLQNVGQFCQPILLREPDYQLRLQAETDRGFLSALTLSVAGCSWDTAGPPAFQDIEHGKVVQSHREWGIMFKKRHVCQCVSATPPGIRKLPPPERHCYFLSDQLWCFLHRPTEEQGLPEEPGTCKLIGNRGVILENEAGKTPARASGPEASLQAAPSPIS